jgi:hypothetical protein
VTKPKVGHAPEDIRHRACRKRYSGAVAGKRDLVVNDLERYTKSSDRLVLEDYSSCEVPAGCGGGILRWIDPLEALPLTLRLWSNGETDAFFDGAPTRSSRVEARPGPHLLALHVRPKIDGPAQLALALRYSDATDPKGTFEPARSRSIGHEIAILSGRDVVMVATAAAPAGDEWKQIAFDHAGWAALTPEAAGKTGEREDWHLKFVKEAGAQVVALRRTRGPIWVRCLFDVALPGGAP